MQAGDAVRVDATEVGLGENRGRLGRLGIPHTELLEDPSSEFAQSFDRKQRQFRVTHR
jgi:hypothetical protein